MNPMRALLPGAPVDADRFWILLAALALADGMRLSLVPPGTALVLFAATVFLSASLLSNRLAAVGRGPGLAVLAAALAAAAKTIVAVIAIALGMYPLLMDYARQAGVDVEDPQAFEQATRSAEFQQGFQDYLLADPERTVAAASAGDWPSAIAYWLVVFAFARGFARRGGPAPQD